MNHEVAFCYAVYKNMLLDLSDRGVLSTPMACAIDANLSRLAVVRGIELFTQTLPALGRIFDALLKVDDPKSEVYDPAFLSFSSLSCDLFGTQFTSEISTQLIQKSISPRTVRAVRELTYLFYKYDYPCDSNKTSACIEKFIQTDVEVAASRLPDLKNFREFFAKCFRGLDLREIQPRHGPGAVSGKETAHQKYDWSSLNASLIDSYGYEYFVASYRHLSEVVGDLYRLPEQDLRARLLTVPKDSRGPRIISCEPKEHQWIQQGIMSRMVQWIEHHPLTRGHVRFTDQSVNACLALQGSKDKSWATLDLSEASDRVGYQFVKETFPSEMFPFLDSCRSKSTGLPDGRVITLSKFAPMGSALCFPVLAMTVYACLHLADIPNSHVYGDDVIVPGQFAHRAITALESIGLKVNRDKSCMTGFFRESCGTDAYRGQDVTPLRLRKRWSNRPNPDAYMAWISYANSFHHRGYLRTANMLSELLVRIYGPILTNASGKPYQVPHFAFEAPALPTPKRRYNKYLHCEEYLCLVSRAKKTKFAREDSYQLLEYFQKRGKDSRVDVFASRRQADGLVSLYTKRGDTRLVRKWTPLYYALV